MTLENGNGGVYHLALSLHNLHFGGMDVKAVMNNPPNSVCGIPNCK
jgi:hypothetical protein